MASSSQPRRLLDLPPELRFEIYSYLTTESFMRTPNYLVVRKNSHKFANLSFDANGSMTIAKAVDFPLPQLASICRQMENETRQLIERCEAEHRLQVLSLLPRRLQNAIATDQDGADEVFAKEMLHSRRSGLFQKPDLLYLDAHSDYLGVARLFALLRKLGACESPLPNSRVLVWNDNEAHSASRPALSEPSYYGCVFDSRAVGKSLARLKFAGPLNRLPSSDPRVSELRACDTRGFEVVHVQQTEAFGALMIKLFTTVVVTVPTWTPDCITWKPFDISDFGNSSGFELFKLRPMPCGHQRVCFDYHCF